MTPRQPLSPKWSDEEILDAIRSHHLSTGEAPRRVDWKRSSDQHPSASTVELRFGSWSKAIAKAGLTPPRRGPRGPRWTRARILDAIRRHYELFQRAPSHRDWVASAPEHPSSATVINRFRSFQEAVRAAGLTPGQSQERIAS